MGGAVGDRQCLHAGLQPRGLTGEKRVRGLAEMIFGLVVARVPARACFLRIHRSGLLVGDGFCADRRDEGVIRGHFTAFSEAQGRVHPNEKPVSLLGYLMSRHPAQTILDPFMGSGTTLVAARDLGRRAIGVEIERKYCDIAIERLRQRALPLSVEERPAHAEQEGLYGTSAK